MNIAFYIILFIVWTMFWSFASVIIYRLRSWEKWILTWRSHCSSCNTLLNSIQLIPIVSWVISKWKCIHCKKEVSKIYPLLEITTWILFSLVWYFLIDIWLILDLNIIEIVKLDFFLTIAFITIIYTFYDILFLEISDLVLALWIIVTIIILSLQTIIPNFQIIENLPYFINSPDLILSWSAIFLAITILMWLYLIMFKELHEIVDILILLASIWALYLFKVLFDVNLKDFAVLNWVMWAIAIFIFFFIQIIMSWWKWMWGWDLRIAILVWLIMWTSLSFAGMMLTYIVWSIIWVSLIIFSKIYNSRSKTDFNSQIPFWPFIWAWFFLALFYSELIIDYITLYLW